MNRPEVIATRLYKARKARLLSRDDLAELTPCSSRTIGAIERQESRMSVSMAIAMAKVLHVKPAWLLDLEE